MGGGGGQGGANSQQAHDVVTTSIRRNDVASTSFRRRVPTRFLINQCQILTFLILKNDIIENSRIELRGMVLPVQVGGLLGGGGGQRVCCPPLSNAGGPVPSPPPLAPCPPLFLRLWRKFLSRWNLTLHSFYILVCLDKCADLIDILHGNLWHGSVKFDLYKTN